MTSGAASRRSAREIEAAFKNIGIRKSDAQYKVGPYELLTASRSRASTVSLTTTSVTGVLWPRPEVVAQ